MLESITNFLLVLLDKVGLLGIFIATIIESFFAPIPSEIVLFTAGLKAKESGSVELLVMMALVASLGNFVGTLPFYLISKYSSDKLLPKFLDKWGPFLLISNDDLKKTEKLFKKHGRITVFVARLIPGIRSLIAFPAGIAKMDFFQYTAFTLAGSFLWNIFLSSIGFLAYDYKDQILSFFKPVETIVLGIIVLVVVIYSIKVALNIRELRKQKTPEITA